MVLMVPVQELLYYLSSYDAIVADDETAVMHEADAVLAARSCLELVRGKAGDEVNNTLNLVDAFWRDKPKEFNHLFRYHHANKDVADELDGLIKDDAGNTPKVPNSHWWWRALEVDEKS